jgi:hypothetical protein
VCYECDAENSSRKWVKIGSFAVSLLHKMELWGRCGIQKFFPLLKNRFMNISKPTIVSSYKTD